MKLSKSAILLIALAIFLLIVTGIFLTSSQLFSSLNQSANSAVQNSGTLDGQNLSAIILLGLTLIVALIAALAIFYAVIGVADAKQALALPEGSVRALIAFSLILIFICLGSFLYKGVGGPDLWVVQTLDCQTQKQIDDLNKNFVVTYQPTTNAKCPVNADTANPKAQQFAATYYQKHNKDGDEFAKLMFNTLSTLLVGILSFYYGSKATSSGVDAGASAASGSSGKRPDEPDLKSPQAGLDGTKAAAHDADSDAKRAQAAHLKDPQHVEIQTAAENAQNASTAASAQVSAATKAFADFNIAKTAAGKSAATTAILKALETANQAAATAKTSADNAEKLLG